MIGMLLIEVIIAGTRLINGIWGHAVKLSCNLHAGGSGFWATARLNWNHSFFRRRRSLMISSNPLISKCCKRQFCSSQSEASLKPLGATGQLDPHILHPAYPLVSQNVHFFCPDCPDHPDWFPRQLQVSALDWKEPRVSGGSWGYVKTRVNLRNVGSSRTFVYNSRMRSKVPISFWGFGGWGCVR